MFVEYNPNPVGRRVGDCAVRAVSAALGMDWEDAYLTLAVNGFLMGDMPSADSVWSATLRQNGFKKHDSPADCLDCYTLSEFAEDHPVGVYVAKTDSHVAAIIDGSIYDSFDSGDEVLQYYWSLD